MTHTTEELHFAAKVRDLAINLRQSEWHDAVHQWEKGKTDEEKYAGVEAFNESWHASHPASGYIQEAYQLIHEAADVISEIRRNP